MLDKLQSSAHINPHVRLAKDDLDEMARRWEVYLEQMGKSSALSRLAEHSSDERELRNRLRESQLRLAGVDEALLSRIREQRKHRAMQIANELAHLDAPYQMPQPDLNPSPVIHAPNVDAPSGEGELGKL